MPALPNPLEIAHQFAVTGRHIARATTRRVSGSLAPGRFPEATEASLRALEETLTAATPPGLREHRLLELPASRGPWIDSGMELSAGETVTWIAAGRVYLSRLADVFVEPHFQLWGRVGAGPIFRGTRSSHTFHADHAGRLFLGSVFPGEWADRSGRLRTSPHGYAGIEGGMTILLLRWSVDALEGLRAWHSQSHAHPLLAAEIDRLEHPVREPEGWKYLWFIGDGEIFTEAGNAGEERRIDCHTRCDVGILQHEVDVPLAPDTRLSWSWQVDVLPSSIAEDTVPTHDYLSIAVEFENGIDVTYHWSAELPVDKGYWCPLPTWKDREFHVAIRSGGDDLGRWLDEERNVYEDYRRYVGTPPQRIVRVWFIANSMLQRGEGRCSWRSIALRSGTGETKVL